MYKKMRAELSLLENRMCNPKNKDKYEYLLNLPSDCKDDYVLLHFHYGRAKTSLELLEKGNIGNQDLIKLDFSASIRKMKILLNKGDWA